jgi:hypothetical protein
VFCSYHLRDCIQMGNVLNLPTEGDATQVENKDKEVFELPSSSVFNDEYVASVYESLPKLVVDDAEEDKQKKDPEHMDADSNLLRIIGILANNRVQISSELDTFKVLIIYILLTRFTKIYSILSLVRVWDRISDLRLNFRSLPLPMFQKNVGDCSCEFIKHTSALPKLTRWPLTPKVPKWTLFGRVMAKHQRKLLKSRRLFWPQ